MGGPRRDLTGQVFTRLTVIERAPAKGHDGYWKCICECGRTVVTAQWKLRHGDARSCGCWSRDRIVSFNTTHGGSGSKEHRAWKGAKTRCYNPRSHKYSLYGGRGIVMCDAWRDSFETFLRDMGPCPDGCTLDRTDVNGPYSADNCRWASPQVQANNRQMNKTVTYHGQTRTVAEWSRIIGKPYCFLFNRLRRGYTVEEAFEQPAFTRFRVIGMRYTKRR